MTPSTTQVAPGSTELRPERETGAPTPHGGTRALLGAIRGYQLLRSGRPTGCRFVPSCSEYASEAIGRFGVLRGCLLAARRLARCGPWGGHGFDPVPEGRAR